jgi:hypothetical protein
VLEAALPKNAFDARDVRREACAGGPEGRDGDEYEGHSVLRFLPVDDGNLPLPGGADKRWNLPASRKEKYIDSG